MTLIRTWLNFPLQQMAAESYLDTIDWNSSVAVYVTPAV